MATSLEYQHLAENYTTNDWEYKLLTPRDNNHIVSYQCSFVFPRFFLIFFFKNKQTVIRFTLFQKNSKWSCCTGTRYTRLNINTNWTLKCKDKICNTFRVLFQIHLRWYYKKTKGMSIFDVIWNAWLISLFIFQRTLFLWSLFLVVQQPQKQFYGWLNETAHIKRNKITYEKRSDKYIFIYMTVQMIPFHQNNDWRSV